MLAYQLSLLGARDIEVAEILGVSESTLNLWKRRHREFSESMVRGKALADAKVAYALFKRATGFSIRREKVAFGRQGEVLRATYREKIVPDTQAAEIWLRNRASALWRDHAASAAESDGEGLRTPEQDLDSCRRIAFVLDRGGRILAERARAAKEDPPRE